MDIFNIHSLKSFLPFNLKKYIANVSTTAIPIKIGTNNQKSSRAEYWNKKSTDIFKTL